MSQLIHEKNTIEIGNEKNYRQIISLYSILPVDCNDIVTSFLIWNIRVGMTIDHKDFVNHWCPAVVLQIKDQRIFIHYIGWDCRWDVWANQCDIAYLGTKSNRICTRHPSRNVREGDMVYTYETYIYSCKKCKYAAMGLGQV